jgi:hypothetical protein
LAALSFWVFSISVYMLMSAAESTSRQTCRGAMEVARRKDDTLPGGLWSQDQLRF